jgi:hypothetical protein
MTSNRAPQNIRAEAQFGLRSLLGFVTVCAVLSAFSAVIGIVAGAMLMLMALALWARQGMLALILFMLASLTADVTSSNHNEAAALGRQFFVILLAAVLCGWYCLRRRLYE